MGAQMKRPLKRRKQNQSIDIAEPFDKEIFLIKEQHFVTTVQEESWWVEWEFFAMAIRRDNNKEEKQKKKEKKEEKSDYWYELRPVVFESVYKKQKQEEYSYGRQKLPDKIIEFLRTCMPTGVRSAWIKYINVISLNMFKQTEINRKLVPRISSFTSNFTSVKNKDTIPSPILTQTTQTHTTITDIIPTEDKKKRSAFWQSVTDSSGVIFVKHQFVILRRGMSAPLYVKQWINVLQSALICNSTPYITYPLDLVLLILELMEINGPPNLNSTINSNPNVLIKDKTISNDNIACRIYSLNDCEQ